MRFQLLGPLSITDGPDTVVLQPSKPTILLASLLLHANTVVSADYLQRTMWGEEQPATSRAALQRRLKEGYLKMIPIAEHNIVRLTIPNRNPDDAVQPVSNQRSTR